MLRKRNTVLVVGSSGGHLLQVLSLQDWYETFDRTVWATFDKPDSQFFIPTNSEVYWLAFPTNRNFRNLLRNSRVAIRVLLKERPRVIVSSGAGGAIPFFLLGRLTGSRLVWIEVIDRIDAPSLTGKLVGRLADRRFVQWASQLGFWKDSEMVGPLFPSSRIFSGRIDAATPRQGTVVALGTHEVRWGRMEEAVVSLVEAGVLPRPVLLQVGPGTGPQLGADGIEQVPMLSPDKLFERMLQAEVVVTHGGPGCICMALSAGHRPFAVAREGEGGDAVDGHQRKFVKFLADQGLVEGFVSPTEFLNVKEMRVEDPSDKDNLFEQASENATRLSHSLKDWTI